MISWPSSLVQELARRRCVLFLGAGVSSSAQDEQGHRPLDWSGFMKAACELVSNPAKKGTILEMIERERHLLALQAISSEANNADYIDFLESHFNNPNFQPSELHKLIYQLDSKVVVTTNFDKIYERYCLGTSTEGFKVIPYHSDDIGDSLRSDTRLIIKAHGTIDEASKMVFTKSEYHNAKKTYGQFYSLLKAIFLTHTCVFIGCSMDDPDMLLVLEDVRITATSQRPHYALLREGTSNEFAIRDWQKAYNIETLNYGPTHEDLISDLGTLVSDVTSYRRTNPQS